jgi:hypothetical protein
MIKGDFHVVEYLGWETTYTEIVPSDRCRENSDDYWGNDDYDDDYDDDDYDDYDDDDDEADYDGEGGDDMTVQAAAEVG